MVSRLRSPADSAPVANGMGQCFRAFPPHCLIFMAIVISVAACSNEKHKISGPDLDAAPRSQAIINSHMHASRLGSDDGAYRAQVIEEMDQHGIVKSVLHINEVSDVRDWVRAAPDRFLAGPSFPCVPAGEGRPDSCAWDEGEWPGVDWLRRHYEDGTFSIMGEMLFVYAGVSPGDGRMDAYWSLAAELDIPVFVHINRGPPPNSPFRPAGCCPGFDSDLGNPALLRPVLEKYPDLRIALQHAGFPAMPALGNIAYTEETFELLRDNPNVYVDMTILNTMAPPPVHAAAVREFVDRGFVDRLMFGTDNLEPGPILQRYREMEFLSEEQLRGILHDNAARFLKLY